MGGGWGGAEEEQEEEEKGRREGAHLVSALYESDVYVCNCGYG